MGERQRNKKGTMKEARMGERQRKIKGIMREQERMREIKNEGRGENRKKAEKENEGE